MKPAFVVLFCAVGIELLRQRIHPEYPDWEKFGLRHSLTVANYEEVLIPILWTLLHTFGIVALSIVVSLVMLAVCVWVPFIRFFIVPNVDFFRAVPVTLICPLLSIAFPQASDYLLCAMGAIPCAAILVFSLLRAYDDIPHERFEIYKLNRGKDRMWLPALNYYRNALMPDFASGVKLTVSYAIVIACVLEMLGFGSKNSSGQYIALVMNNNASMLGTPMVLILAMGLVSFAINAAISHWERRLFARRF